MSLQSRVSAPVGSWRHQRQGDTEVDEEQAEAVLIAVVLLKGELVVNGGKREAPADGQNQPLKAVAAAWPCVPCVETW